MASRIRAYGSTDFGDGLRYCADPGIVYQEDTSRSIEYGEEYWNNYLRYEQSPLSDPLNNFRAKLAETFCKAVLDIGIGCGTFLREVHIPAYGYDINPIAVQYLQDRSLYRDPYDSFPSDVNGVTLWDVLEHMPNPDDLLDRLPVGTFVLTSLPIFDDLTRLRESKHFKENEHYLYMTAPGLERYMDDSGFGVVMMSNEETRIGRDSIMTFVFRKLRQPRPATP